MKILIVDDNSENIEMMMILLKSKSYDVTSASNGQEALEKLRSDKFDLIISDILMPVMDGFRLCMECKKDIQLSTILFIFYSATYIDKKDEEFALMLGAQKFIRKPQEPEVFLDLIKEVTEKSANVKIAPIKHEEHDEKEILKLYSERLITKLEKKNLDLENEIASHKITISKLKDSEERFRSFIEQSSQGIILTDERGIIIECNKVAESITRLRTEQITGVPLWDLQLKLMPPESNLRPEIESFKDILPEFIRTGQSTYFDKPFNVNLLTSKGEYKTVLQSVFPIKTSMGYHIGTVLNDITELTKAEEAFSKEQYLLNSLIDTIPDNIYFKDGESRFIRINNTMAKMFGLNNPQDASGKTDYDFFDKEHASLAFEDEQRIIATGEPLIAKEEKEVWPDGHIAWASTTKIPLRDKAGEIIGIMGISRDITDRKEAEEKMQHLAAIVQSSEDAIIGKRIDGTITSWNKGAEKLYGYTENEMIGKSISHLIPPNNKSEMPEILDRILSGEHIEQYETVRRRKDGQDIQISLTISPIRDPEGRIIAASTIGRDITNHKRVETTLRELSLRQDAILAAVPDIIMEVDNDKVYTWANKAGLEFFGEDVIGKEAQYYFEGEQETYFEVQPIFSGDESTVYIESWQRRKDGQKRLLAWWCRVLKDGEGGVTGALSTARDITERKLAEEALQESEALLSEAMKIARLGTWEYDVVSDQFTFNDQFYTLLHTTAELEGGYIMSSAKYAQRFVYQDDIAVVGVEIQKALETTDPEYYSRLDHRIICADGEIGYITVHIRIEKDANGRTVKTYGVNQDMTKRMQAEEAIIKERSLLRTLIDNLPNGVFVKDKEYRKIIINPVHQEEVKNHLKYLKLNSEIDILGKIDSEVFPKKMAQQFFLEDQKVIKEGSKILNREGIGFGEDGNQLWLLVSKIPLQDKNGEILGMVGVTTDITERKHAVEALETSEEKFRTIFDNANDGIFLLDPETKKFMMCNQACLKMLGYSGEEFLNLDITTIHPSEELPFIFEQIEKILRGEEDERSDIKFKHKDGTSFTADIGPTLVTIGQKRFMLVAFRDISQRLLMETDLRSAKLHAEESDRLKTAFLHNISHEIRTPLNGIMGFSDLITNPDLLPEKREQFCQIIHDCGNQLLSIVSDIISIAQIEAGQEKPQEKEVDINKLLQLINSQNTLNTETKNLSFAVSSDLTDDEAIVLVDEPKLIQILNNLVSNAIKFTLEGHIKVNCRLDSNFIKFTVEDTGLGIPSEIHEKIFDRFFQIDHGDERLYGGTGMGLSIVKSFVNAINGEIHLDSKPGIGSVFIISIPYKPVKPRRPVTITVQDEHKPTGVTSILIAEDIKTNFELLNEYLSGLNATIIYAANGLQAVEACKHNPSISLVLMDVKMPIMDGYEAARQIKGFRPELPIIIQTAYVFQSEKEKFVSTYIDGFIEKPIKKDVLLEVLQKNSAVRL